MSAPFTVWSDPFCGREEVRSPRYRLRFIDERDRELSVRARGGDRVDHIYGCVFARFPL